MSAPYTPPINLNDRLSPVKELTPSERYLYNIDNAVNAVFENKFESEIYNTTDGNEQIIWANCNTISIIVKSGSISLRLNPKPDGASEYVELKEAESKTLGGYQNTICRDKISYFAFENSQVEVVRHWVVPVIVDPNNIMYFDASTTDNFDLGGIADEKVLRWKDLSTNFYDLIYKKGSNIQYDQVNDKVDFLPNGAYLKVSKPLNYVIDGTQEISIEIEALEISLQNDSSCLFSEFLKLYNFVDGTLSNILVFDKNQKQVVSFGIGVFSPAIRKIKLIFRRKSLSNYDTALECVLIVTDEDNIVWQYKSTYTPFELSINNFNLENIEGTTDYIYLKSFKIYKS